MLSTESQAQNQQSTAYDERVFNERIRQLFNSIDSSSISQSALSPPRDTGPMTSIVDALFPEQASLHQQQKQRDQQRYSSTNDITAAFERFPLWNNNNNNNNSSASAFCGGTSNGSSAFANRRQSKLHSSSRSLRNANCHNQQQHQYRPPPQTRPRFTSSIIRLPSSATTTTTTTTVPHTNSTTVLQRSSSSSLSTNNGTSGTTDYQPRFASRLSSTRLPSAAPPAPVGSHDQITGNGIPIDPIASSLGVMGQPSSTTAVLARSTSSTNAQPYVTMTQTTTTTFCYVPASASLAYNTLPGTNRHATVSHH